MTDAELIDRYGGPKKLAELLGYTKPGSVQRVSNWTRRGIPAAEKVKHPELLLRPANEGAPPVEARAA